MGAYHRIDCSRGRSDALLDRYVQSHYARIHDAHAPSLVSALTVVLWEHLLTLHLEVHHIWARSLDGTKVIFLFNRYTVEAGLLYTVYCTSADDF